MTSPLVSIITPSYNQGAFIEATIYSVLKQDYPRIEYVVVDGGSNDQTLDVLRRLEGKLRWISEPDDGQSSAINKGVAMTSGPVIGWLNADDLYVPRAVASVVEALDAHPTVAFVYGDADWLAADGRFVSPCVSVQSFSSRRLMRDGNFIVQPSAFFRRQAFEAVGKLDESLHYVMDYDLWIRLGKKGGASYINQPLAQVRCHGQSKTSRGGQMRLQEMATMLSRHGGRGLSGYYRLEAAALAWTDAVEALAQRRPRHLISAGARALKQLLSLRALRSLLSPRTWRIIRVRRLRDAMDLL